MIEQITVYFFPKVFQYITTEVRYNGTLVLALESEEQLPVRVEQTPQSREKRKTHCSH